LGGDQASNALKPSGVEKDAHVEADLYNWTRQVMDRVEERAPDFGWVARAHRDHSNHDLVHVVAALERRLDRDDLRDLRDYADAA